MNKIKINYIIDLLLLICFIIVSISGIILMFSSGRFMILGTNKIFWLKSHVFSGFGFMVFGLLHFILHLKWLNVMTRSFFKK